ncbi:flagellar basal body rod protein FlgB [Acidilutibacter cellobiosedens]|mgnify:FL=1|uniref:Flagellar basal body rod protein FlgB n=1 Tax=Acidilutibacter cellobiosedens TaxID=2507161 RepID=A0A410QC97_9FIRM|nr:flagellar basal body rod protein FlgB [Acidilutibacter cellobiosedens]MBE6081766.1 flagellar basal body rod protein FlgB [Tissierellaceae bacterium]QAT61600.1 flagellar basal body rod protein FlgB [Acidilutibacter cellobiosedens]
MLEKLFSNSDYLKTALDGSWLRNKAITQNIANSSTPNYKRVDVDFQTCLKNASENYKKMKLTTTDEKHIPYNGYTREGEGVKVYRDEDTSYRFDGNNVNIDTEEAELSKNEILYSNLLDQISDEYTKIKKVISEGSKY